MINSATLPDVTFIAANGTEEALCLSRMTGRMHAAAAQLQETLPAGGVIGLMLPTGPDLVIGWIACLLAGLRPLMMAYPTGKLNRTYWAETVQATLTDTGMQAIIADRACRELGLTKLTTVIEADALAGLPPLPEAAFVLNNFSILQQSSGTTGQRKAVAFTAAQLDRHVHDFNATLGLTPADRIVSWLPLYHDMGAIACFVMPLMLGIPVIMMGPVTWVKSPALLFDAIVRHGGSVCYMPNFGFEVMCREKAPLMPSMRWWISCSEPVSAATARMFLAHVDADESVFAPCYAMAENVFAISIRRGLRTHMIDGTEVVSCGPPIAGVTVKTDADGRLLVASPTALDTYLAGAPVRDAEGFYATGDMGLVVEGEVFVAGRERDILLQAGRKFMLSDVDLALNRMLPDLRGRAASLAVPDPRLGTEELVVLIEAVEFWARTDGPAIAQMLRETVGVDHASVHFVPPRFLTKTSSGKINRKRTAADWLAHTAHVGAKRSRVTDYAAELKQNFGTLDWDIPVERALDSLSATVLRVLLSDAGVAYDGGQSLNEISAELGLARPGRHVASEQVGKALHIVSLADTAAFRGSLRLKHLNQLAQRVGRRIVFEQLCLPPTPVLLSDLIFNDWFQPRLDQTYFSAIDLLLGKLRAADAIVLDDRAEFVIAHRQVYGVLSHLCERNKLADLLMTRWQRYAQHNDKLPMTIASGGYLRPEDRAEVHRMFASYLGKPLFRIRTTAATEPWAADWEYTDIRKDLAPMIDPDRFIAAFGEFMLQKHADLGAAEASARPGRSTLTTPELGHYCAHMARRETVYAIVEKFDSLCIVGQPSSLPLLRKRAKFRGKRFIQLPSFAPEVLNSVKDHYDCIVLCGAWGMHPTEIPTIAIMHADESRQAAQNMPDETLAGPRMTAMPAPADDWFYPFAKTRTDNKPIQRARLENARWRAERPPKTRRSLDPAAE